MTYQYEIRRSSMDAANPFAVVCTSPNVINRVKGRYPTKAKAKAALRRKLNQA